MRKLAPRSLVARLVLGGVAVCLLIVVPLGLTAWMRAQSAVESATIERLDLIASGTERQLRAWIARQSRSVEYLAGLEELTGSWPSWSEVADAPDVAEETSALLRRYSSGFPDLLEVFLLTPVGGAVFASSDPARVGDFRVTDAFYLEGRSATHIQAVYPSPLDGRPTITISAPVVREGEVRAVLAAHLDLHPIDQLVADGVGLGTSGETYLVSTYNDIVSAERFGHPDHLRGTHSEGIEAALSGQVGPTRYRNYRGAEVLGAQRWLPRFELALITEIERAEALAPLDDLLAALVLLSGMSVMLLVLGMAWMAGRISQPVLAISSAARRVARGDLTVQAPVQTDDEVGSLARAFNHMTAQLRSLVEDLNHQVQERERAMETVAAERDRAERADRAKGDFLAMISHEIRTPMNGVLGMSEALRHSLLGPEQRGYVDTIQSSARALLTIIDDILDFNKIEAGKLAVESIPFRVRHVLGEVEGLLRMRASNKGVSFTCTVSEDVPEGIMGDPGRLRQVLLNLAGNAVKFTERGFVQVVATRARDGTAPDRVRIAVEDSGIGIAPTDLDRLFDAFEQADPSTTRRFGGTGLGLAITRNLVHLMGGVIHAESDVGQGSRFVVDLPCVPAKVESHHGSWTPVEADEEPLGLRVLVVEDNPVNVTVARAFLKRLGCEVEVANNGQVGVQAASEVEFDLILMDCRMPVLDGFDATRIIREREERAGVHTPIVAMTANARLEDRQQCLDAGMDDYLAKPVELGTLKRTLVALTRDAHPEPSPRRTPQPA